MGNTFEDVYRAKAIADIKDLKTVADAIDGVGDSLDDFDDAAKGAESQSKKTETGIGNLASSFSVASVGLLGLTAAFAGLSAVAAVAVNSALEQENALKLVKAQTGATDQEMRDLEKTIDEVFTGSTIAESYDDAANAASIVNRQLKLQGDELTAATNDALLLSKVFDKDVTESTRAAGNMMEVFGLNSEQSYDLLARGLQVTGDPADDLLDTFNEYSDVLAQMGFDAEESLGLIAQGLDNGAMSSDEIVDSLQEFNINLEDIEGRGGAFRQVLDPDALAQFEDGTLSAKDALSQAITQLNAIEDPADRAALGVQLFGTRFEELETAILSLDPTTAVSALGEIEGTTDEMAATMDEGAIPKIQAFGRSLKDDLGDGLRGLIDTGFTELQPHLESFSNWMTTTGSPALQTFGTDLLNGVGGVDGIATAITTLSDGLDALTLFDLDLAQAIIDGFDEDGVSGAVIALLDGVILNSEEAMTWASANLVTPMLDALSNPENWVAASEISRAILDGIITEATEIGEWAKPNLIDPILNALTNQENWIAASEASRALLTAMGTAIMDGTIALGDWVLNNILTPIATEIGNQAESAFGQVTGIGQDILDGLIADLPDIPVWVDTNLIQPIKNGIAALEGAFKGGINAMIPDQITIDLGSVDTGIPYVGVINIGSKTLNVPDPFPEFANGGQFTVPSTGQSGDVPFLMGLTAGERVQIAPKGEPLGMGGNMTINLMMPDGEILLSQIVQANNRRGVPAF